MVAEKTEDNVDCPALGCSACYGDPSENQGDKRSCGVGQCPHGSCQWHAKLEQHCVVIIAAVVDVLDRRLNRCRVIVEVLLVADNPPVG